MMLLKVAMWFYSSPQDIEQFKAEIEKRQLKDLPIPGVLSELRAQAEAGAESWGRGAPGPCLVT